MATMAVAKDERVEEEKNGEVEIPRKFALPNRSVFNDA
jgi:hypothetical protein